MPRVVLEARHTQTILVVADTQGSDHATSELTRIHAFIENGLDVDSDISSLYGSSWDGSALSYICAQFHVEGRTNVDSAQQTGYVG